MDEAIRRIAELERALAERDAIIAERDAEVARMAAEVMRLTELLATLRAQIGRDSSNSSKPPSSDTPASRASRNQRKQARRDRRAGRKRGGQKGHKGHRRELLAESKVDELVDLYPEQCENCWEPLPQVADSHPKRDQYTELPPVKPHTTEFRRHKVRCVRCGHRTRAKKDERIPKTAFGPRLTALMALLTGIYHLSRRKTQQLLSDVVGVQVSLGALSAAEARVSDAVAPAVDEAWDRVGRAKVKHTDGTSWFQAGVALSLWTIATVAATVFKIVTDGSRATLEPLYGALRGILVSDRAKVLGFWAMDRRQVCWAHLIRRFVSFSERDGPAGAFGRELLDYTGVVFEYWHDYKAGKLTRETFFAWMAPVREQVQALLARAVAADIKGLSGSCADILAHKEALWTFVEQGDVEPTNNHAERELRAFVLWRKRCFGTQSQRGNLFAERLMTVAHTARKQNKNVLAFLTACCQPDSNAQPLSLFEAEVAAA